MAWSSSMTSRRYKGWSPANIYAAEGLIAGALRFRRCGGSIEPSFVIVDARECFEDGLVGGGVVLDRRLGRSAMVNGLLVGQQIVG